MKNSLILFVKLILILALTYYIFHDINVDLLLPALQSYSWFWLGVATFSVITSDFILALRWRSLSKRLCTLRASFESIVFSVLANTLLPAKLGEVAKIFYLKKLYHMKLSHGFSLMLTERFFDLLILGILIVLTAQIYWNDFRIQLMGWIIILLIIATFFLIRSPLARYLIRWFPTASLRRWLIRLYHHFQIVLAKESMLNLTFWSLLLWSSYIFTTILFFKYVMGLELQWTEFFIATMVAFVAFSIPLLPAGSGTFQAGVIFILTQYGVGKEEALIGSIVLQLLMVVPSSLIALIIMHQKSLSFQSFTKESL